MLELEAELLSASITVLVHSEDNMPAAEPGKPTPVKNCDQTFQGKTKPGLSLSDYGAEGQPFAQQAARRVVNPRVRTGSTCHCDPFCNVRSDRLC
jgi:hypothetical protein